MDVRASPSSGSDPGQVGPGAVFDAMARYFALLADPTRLKVLHSICESERQVSAIVETTGVTQTSVSRHLALLHRAGVVSRRKVQRSVYYQVGDQVLADICRTVCVQMAGRIDEKVPLRDDLLEFASRR